MTARSRKRRCLLSFGAVSLAWPGLLTAQQKNTATIGFLFTPSRQTSQMPELFSAAMRRLGWVEGENLTLEWRFAEGRAEDLRALAADLVRRGVQAIVAPFNIEASAAREATSTIPIVMIVAADPIGAGLAQSIAKPAGNVTGVLYADPQFSAKSLQILRELVPAMRRLGYLYPDGIAGMQAFISEIEGFGKAFGISSHRFPVSSTSQVSSALEEARRQQIDALRVSYTGPVQAALPQILAFAAANKVPTIYTVPTPVERGGLLSYAPRLADNAARAAAIVDKLLRGGKAAETPFEYPTQFELVINMKAARALGLSLPQSILLRTDRLIE